MTHKSVLLLAAKLFFSCLLLWAVLTKVDVSSVVARLGLADPRWLVPSLFLGPGVVILGAWRWRGLSLDLITLSEAVRYTWIGIFFGSILPGVVGGDVAKGVALAAKETRARDARLPVSILVDKLVGLWTLLLFFSVVALIMLGTQPQLLAGMRGALWTGGGLAAGGLLAAAAICHPQGAACYAAFASRLPTAPARVAATRLLTAFGSYGGQARLLLRAALISIVLHGLNALSLWLVLRSLAIPASFWFAMVFYSLLSVLLALPVSISGLGVRDVFAASIFTAFGLNPESGVAFSWLLLGLSIPSALIGGAIQLWEMFRRRAVG